MKYTDENGDKYEEFGFPDKGDPYIVIRPVKEEPKWSVELFDSGLEGWDKCIDISLNTTEAQANLIREAIEALMIAINSRYELDSPILLPNGKQRVEMAIAMARQALQKDKS